MGEIRNLDTSVYDAIIADGNIIAAISTYGEGHLFEWLNGRGLECATVSTYLAKKGVVFEEKDILRLKYGGVTAYNMLVAHPELICEMSERVMMLPMRFWTSNRNAPLNTVRQELCLNGRMPINDNILFEVASKGNFNLFPRNKYGEVSLSGRIYGEIIAERTDAEDVDVKSGLFPKPESLDEERVYLTRSSQSGDFGFHARDVAIIHPVLGGLYHARKSSCNNGCNIDYADYNRHYVPYSMSFNTASKKGGWYKIKELL